jgi:PAS domain S-box-containing protein
MPSITAETDALYRSLVEHVPAILYRFSPRQGGTFYSPQVTDFLGYTPEELLAEPHLWTDSIHPADRPAVDVAIAGIAEGLPFDLEYRIRDAAGAWRWFHDRSVHNSQEQGEQFVVGVVIDVTPVKQLEEQRRELEHKLRDMQRFESLGVLAGGVAHDFNNLLMAMTANLALAEYALAKDSAAHAHFQAVRLACERAALITQQILTYAGRGPLVKRALDLNRLVAENVEIFRPTLPKHVTVDVRLAPDMPLIQAAEGFVQQVIMNLITNGGDALEPCGRTLRVATERLRLDAAALAGDRSFHTPPPGDYACLEVADDGVGMNAAVLERLCEPFFTTKPNGRGLGMATVQGVVRRHDGALFIDSAPGAGTRVRACFPLPGGAR